MKTTKYNRTTLVGLYKSFPFTHIFALDWADLARQAVWHVMWHPIEDCILAAL